MDELDGMDTLVFNGPFNCLLSTGAEVRADKLVIGSKMGSVAELPVSKLRTIKQKVLNLLYEHVSSQITAAGANKVLHEGGAVIIGEDLFWQKTETITNPIIIKKTEQARSIQDLKRISMEME